MRELRDQDLYLELWRKLESAGEDVVHVWPDVQSLGYFQVIYVPLVRSDLIGQIAGAQARATFPPTLAEISTWAWWKFWR